MFQCIIAVLLPWKTIEAGAFKQVYKVFSEKNKNIKVRCNNNRQDSPVMVSSIKKARARKNSAVHRKLTIRR
ncbi:hypothetical protein LBYZC6_36990 [Lacrimispora brassicae]